MVMSGISAMPRVAQGVRRGIGPASKPASGRGSRIPPKRDLAGAEAFRLAGGGADNEGALVVDAGGGAGQGDRALRDADSLAAEDVKALPERGKLVAVVVLDEAAIGGEDAGDERGGKAVDVDQGAGGLGEGDGGGLDLARQVIGAGVEVEAEAEDEVADLIGVDARL